MLGILKRLRDDADKCADALLWSMSDTDLVTAVEQVHRLEQTLAAVKLHLIGEVDRRDLASSLQARDTAGWLRWRLRLDPGTARQLVDQAAAMRRHPAVDAALCAGTIHLRQASAICDAVDALPTPVELATAAEQAITTESASTAELTSTAEPTSTPELAAAAASSGDLAFDGSRGDADPATVGEAEAVVSAAELAAAAEAALLGFAADFAPGPLRRLGARILDHVAPDVADRLDAIALERDERRARRQRGLTLSPPVGGLVRVHGHLTVEDATVVSAALDPLSCPGTDADSRSPAQLRADALVEVCWLAMRTGELPDSGGEPPQLAVTVAYDPLTRALGVGRLDGGDRLSPAAVRRLACDAQILPVVLGGAGQVLDAGRVDGSPPARSGGHWWCGIEAAASRTVIGRRDGATVTTSGRGRRAGRRR